MTLYLCKLSWTDILPQEHGSSQWHLWGCSPANLALKVLILQVYGHRASIHFDWSKCCSMISVFERWFLFRLQAVPKFQLPEQLQWVHSLHQSMQYHLWELSSSWWDHKWRAFICGPAWNHFCRPKLPEQIDSHQLWLWLSRNLSMITPTPR